MRRFHDFNKEHLDLKFLQQSLFTRSIGLKYFSDVYLQQ